MVELRLSANSLLDGKEIMIGDNRIVERDDLALVSIATPIDGEKKLASAMKKAFGLAHPDARQSALSGDIRSIRMGPDQQMLLFPREGPDANALVQQRLKGAGYTTDQTDAWIVLEVSGPQTLEALERICPLDLHPEAFPVDGSGRTMMEHMGALLVRLEENRFLLLSASSSSASFLHAVETSFHNVL